jgi:hypothetical protein
MTQTSVDTWAAGVQAKLMAAIDAAWAIIETSDDPAAVRRARDKAKACGELAATARKVAGMAAVKRPAAVFPRALEAPEPEAAPMRGLDRLKGGGRGRL